MSTKEEGRVLGFASRYVEQGYRVPKEEYTEALPRMVEELAGRNEILMPVSTLSMATIVRKEERLRDRIHFLLPSSEGIGLATDKESTVRRAQEVGVPVPERHPRPEPGDEERWAEALEPHLPLVLKFPNDRRGEPWAPEDRYSIVSSRRALVSTYRAMARTGSPPMVQEYVEGDGYGFFALMGPEGERLASFGHRRLREYPVTGGPSTLCESVSDPELFRLGARMLEALDWRGVAMVEFKRERTTGTYKLMEVNPRYWGSLPLALQCGINFPEHQARAALGLPARAPRDYPVGRRMRFLFSDLAAVRDEWGRGRKLRVAWGYLKELCDGSIRDGLIDLEDPWPVASYVCERLAR